MSQYVWGIDKKDWRKGEGDGDALKNLWEDFQSGEAALLPPAYMHF